jgi:GDP-4-dehydro-6-deoxy-D-mannose reductase
VVETSRSRGLDLLDADATRAFVAREKPDVVYHLAAQAHVGRSWAEPGPTLHDNLSMTLSLLEAVRSEAPGAVFVFVGSGEEYGPPASLPVTEEAVLRPANPYAVSKAASDMLAALYASAHALRIVRARPFNHSGPGQEPIYAIASFARQVAQGLEAAENPVRVVTGNPDTRRDYTDVRDVVRAYRELAVLAEPDVFNVCSGRPASAAELLAALSEGCGVEIDHQVNPDLIRAHEVMEVRGSAAKLNAATGWQPTIPLPQTLADTVDWWRTEIRAGRAPALTHE